MNDPTLRSSSDHMITIDHLLMMMMMMMMMMTMSQDEIIS